MHGDIPVSIVIAAKDEASNLPRCLSALSNFSDIWVVDSLSQDSSRAIAESYGAQFIDFSWDGQYPKKRQWCLETLPLKYDFVFFVDADEEVTHELFLEIASLDFSCAGYFIKGAYVLDGHVLAHGLKNNKLCLIDRRKMCFPVVDDIGVDGMGEIEGHYQPVMKDHITGRIGYLRHALLHHAYDEKSRYDRRHEGYRIWEEGMKSRHSNIQEPLLYRRILKSAFSNLPRRDVVAFLHSYILLAGFLDGRHGFEHARNRYKYYAQRRA